MKRKILSGMMLTLLFIGILALAFDIQSVQASGTIYIKADGSVEPPAANITSADNVTYYFTDNNYDEIVIERSNIIVDGNGYTLQCFGNGHGFRLTSISNVTIRNTNVKADFGIWLESSSNNTFSGNNITTTGWGIMVLYSSNNRIFGNNITKHNWGIELAYSSNNVLRNNTITGPQYKFRVRGSTLSHFVQDVDESNTVDGKPICYLVNRQDMEVPSDAGYVGLVNSTNITVEGLELKGNGEGILLAYTTDSQITNNTVTDNYESARLESSSNNTFSGNNITDNLSDIILYSSSNNNTFSGNIIADALGGVRLYESSNNKFYGNDIRNNTFGNMYLQESFNNIISGNNITDSTGNGTPGYGVGLYLSSNNTFSGNNITDNDCGIRLSGSSNNNFCHNKFINNTDQVNILTSGYANFWDDGYPSGGNYWSDYTGVDVKRGPGQDQPGSDGIGDTPNVIDADNVDHYPLMQHACNVTIRAYCYNKSVSVSLNITMDGSPTGFNTPHNFTGLIGPHTFTVPSIDPHDCPFRCWSTGETSTTITVTAGGTYTAYYGRLIDVAVTNVTSLKTVVGQGYSTSINVTVENRGDDPETFNVTLYANTTTIATFTNIALTSGNSTTITFTWPTTGFAKGNYTISANATILPGEADTADNNKIDGWVMITIVGDVNGDRIVDVVDLTIVSLALWAEPGEPKWNPNADLNEDEIIDVVDLTIVSIHLWETW